MEIYIHGSNGNGGLGGHLVVPVETVATNGVTLRRYEFENYQGEKLVVTYFDYSTQHQEEEEV